MAAIPPVTQQTPITATNNIPNFDSLRAEYALDPPTQQSPNLNPPPTEGLLWPRFDYQIPE